ncbi:MAG: excinuclease ABC subunit UvrC [Alphaproteobacteria bacterium]|nr:MAG: excinuclease ABC subunit UvrC [Alphaproteobacteria bacterium]
MSQGADKSDNTNKDGVTSRPTGPEVVKSYLKTLPGGPGVYRMIDEQGDALYVGKAGNLKKRVTSYTKLSGHTNRIARMIAATAEMEFTTTETESEALLLEANLIKRLKPYYNILLRDDKSFPYILMTEDHPFSQVVKHRGARNRKGRYFGPFASAGAVNRTLNTLQRAFLLRSCSDSVFESRTRPCLLYQIKRCSAPCVGYIDEESYAKLIDETIVFLDGKSRKVQSHLSKLMDTASERLDFEQAASYRDRIHALTAIQAHQGINPKNTEEADVFAAKREGGQVCIQVFFFRAKQNWGNRAYFPRHDKSETLADVLESFLAQFYDNKPPAKLILLNLGLANQHLLADALSIKAERKISIFVPKRGERRDLVNHALVNAREALARRFAESASQRRLLEAVADTFDLDRPPQRIEVYDNSHIQGTNAVGAMIVGGPEGFQKNEYRKFNIRSDAITPGDDYGMMRQVLTRRFTRLLKETAEANADDERPWPDLVIIDGGRGQLGVARDVFAELGVDGVPLVAIAKGPDRNAGRERLHMLNHPSFILEPNSPVLYYLQRLRDEAHRFAIGSHRSRRKKDIGASPLDDIPGIGAKRKRALLHHFGSARSVKQAGLADLEAVEGISQSMAKRIYDYFHNDD